MNSRNDIKDFILQVESKFSVNDWQVDGVHIWPYLRIRLFFFLIRQVEQINNQTDQSNFHHQSDQLSKLSPFHFLKYLLKQIYGRLFLSNFFSRLPQKKIIFLGSDAHRVPFKNKRYNRYFDVLIDKYNIHQDAIYFEYDSKALGNQYNQDLVYKFQKALQYFLKYRRDEKIEVKLDRYADFLTYLEESGVGSSFIKSNSNQHIDLWARGFIKKIQFFKTIINSIDPEKLVILCYYSDNVMAFTAAANQEGVKTIEMQHGPQTAIHMAYSNWTKIPALGYDMLPRHYWCWDFYSKEIISTWAKPPLYSVQISGNPWVNYWKENVHEYSHKNFVLYALQPNQVCTIQQLFPPSIVNFIKNQPYQWFLRLHPRQIPERESLVNYLKQNGISELVNIDEATNDPLPLLLLNAALHVTHCSGSTIEAAFFDTHTVLINKIGIDSFPELIAQGQASFHDPENENFELLLLEHIKKANSNYKSDSKKLAPEKQDFDLFKL